MQAHACVHKLNTCKQQAHLRVDKFAYVTQAACPLSVAFTAAKTVVLDIWI